MARYKVKLAYDGTQFRGFQKQRSARTVQSEVESALQGLGWQGQSLLAAGRTDTGVHASGQVIAFDLEWGHPAEDLQRAMNALLPDDVVARTAEVAPEGFHPRYDAAWRAYRYRIYCQPERDPLRDRYAWRVWPAVDLQQLDRAADLLPGRHDFAAFGTPPKKGGSTLRTVLRAGWLPEGEQWVFEIAAQAFLYHMVRRLVAFQVEIGQGRLPVQAMGEVLENPQTGAVQGLAPARGLVLAEVCYTKE